MQRAGSLLIVCLLPILGAGLAHAADCEFLTSGSWGPFDTYTGTLDCATPQASDSYIVPSGVTVDVIDDILLAGTPGEQISVKAGGTFRIRALARQSGAGRLVLSMNRQGLVCDSGSTCEFEGAFRRNDDLGPALQSDLDSDVHLEAGAILPCPGWNASASSWESDCAAALQGPSDLPGSTYEVGFHYIDLASTAPTTNAAFATLEVKEILCFYDANRDDPLAPVDDGFCYEIVWVSPDGSHPDDASAMLKIDIRQTNPDRPRNSSYPFSLREVRYSSLAAPTTLGSTIVAVEGNTLLGIRDRERVGMWLRFADPAGNPLDQAYKISRTWNAPPDGMAPIDCPISLADCDIVEIYDPRGFQTVSTLGASIWIDYGHRQGDDFFVVAAVVLTEGDGVQDPTKFRSVTSVGSVRMVGVLADDLSGIRLLESEGAVVKALWLRDTTGGSLGWPGKRQRTDDRRRIKHNV